MDKEHSSFCALRTLISSSTNVSPASAVLELPLHVLCLQNFVNSVLDGLFNGLALSGILRVYRSIIATDRIAP